MTEKSNRVASAIWAMPYARHLGIGVAGNGGADSILFHLPFEARLVGNVTLPAYHGGAVAAFMQVAALTTVYDLIAEDRLPKLVNFAINYPSSAGPQDLYAKCEVHRVGRRIATVGIRCWQNNPEVPVALSRAHVFIGPQA
jgi:acyl-coenzyme A thioesterase PaaI-like protein